jgi:PKD repeat protein
VADELKVTVTPDLPAGSFSGEGTSATNNVATFKPSAVNLAAALKKEVTLGYASGGSTATQKVTVYAAPKASFKAAQSAPGALSIVLTDVVVAGESIQWQLNGENISTDANPQELKVEKNGIFKVSVLVKNGPCEAATADVEVEVAEAPTPTIGIKPKQFCNASTDTVPVDLGPAPLALDGYNGEGTVVQAGQPLFVPILVQLGTAASKEVVLSYSAFGKTAETKVTVFALPQGSIAAFPSTASALSYQVKNNVNFGTRFSWKVNGQEFSTEREPGLQKAEKPGTYTITLDVANGACKNSFTATVVLAQQEVAPVCSTLGQWAEEYAQWKTKLGRLFISFNRFYGAMPAVDALFTQQMPPMLAQATAQQINALNNVASPGTILEWMSLLSGRLIVQNTDFRAPAIDLFRILDGLLMFYACNQTADIDKAKIPTQPSFEKVIGMVGEWRQVSQGFTAADRTMVGNFTNTVKKESDNVSATAPGKKIYLEILAKLADILNSI